MLKGKTVAVVVPTYNEEKQIKEVVATMPNFVDRIVVVNDSSTDKTVKIVKNLIKKDNSPVTSLNGKKKIEQNKYNHAEFVLEDLRKQEDSLYTPAKIENKDPYNSRIILISHLKNASVGATLATGYRWCRDHNIDCTARMDGDGQMDPDELEKICLPIIEENIDYVKSNRLRHRSALLVIPKIRYFGNSILSLLTKIASGYWRVSDSQTGYTAISLQALRAIRIHRIYPSYGCPNDILVKLNIAFCTVREVDSKPVYNVGEDSKMKELRVVPGISWLLFKSFWKRLYKKYLFRDFHPLFVLYNFGIGCLLASIPFGIKVFGSIPMGAGLEWQFFAIFAFLFVLGMQSLAFAMWMDMMDNERLYK